MANPTAALEDALRANDYDRVFYELINHPTQPLTVVEFIRLVALHPERWGRYVEWISLLNGQAADRKSSALSGLG